MMNRKTVIVQALVGFVVFFLLFFLTRLLSGLWLEGQPMMSNWRPELWRSLLPAVIFIVAFRGRSLWKALRRPRTP